MANDKLIQSRISLKIDTWANWHNDTFENKGANLILKKGEVAFVQVGSEIPPVVHTETGEALLTNPNTVLFKVGDGFTPFKNLNWGSGIAADVYSWAKQDEEQFKAWLSGETKKEGSDGTLVPVIGDPFVLKSVHDSALTALSGSITTISGNISNLAERVSTLENVTGTESGSTAVLATKAELKETADKLVGEDSSTTDKTIKGAYAKADAAQTKADSAYTTATSNQTKISSLETEIGNLSSRVSTLENDKAGKDELQNYVPFSIYNPKIQSLEEADTSINSTLTGLKDTVDFFFSGAGISKEEAGKYKDTLKEIQEYINQDVDAAASMTANIQANTTAIDILKGDGEGSVTKKVNDAINTEVTNRNTAILNAINALDVSQINLPASKTIKTIEQTDGKIAVTTQDIKITKSQISDFGEYADKQSFDEHVTNYNNHVTKAVTTEDYLVIDCGSSTVCID